MRSAQLRNGSLRRLDGSVLTTSSRNCAKERPNEGEGVHEVVLASARVKCPIEERPMKEDIDCMARKSSPRSSPRKP